MNFVGEFKEKPKKIFLVHGEEEAQNVLKGKIEEEYGIETEIPSFGDVFRVDEIVEKEENYLEKKKLLQQEKKKSNLQIRYQILMNKFQCFQIL